MTSADTKDAGHSPTPWTEGDIGLVDADGASVDVANLRVGWVSAFENPRAVANGRLMRSAPELLEALKAARDYMDFFGCDKDMAPTMDKIEAAISRAEGR